MNLVLIEPEELRADGTVRLEGRRLDHVREIIRAPVGSWIRAGVVGGQLGTAEILALSGRELVLRPVLAEPPPPPSRVSLLVALPRPKILRRVLQAIASMGVKRVVLVGSWRVDKSFFGSSLLDERSVRRELLLGLEQGRDTIVPEVRVRRFFKPFVEDELEDTFASGSRLLAHPGGARTIEAIAARADRVVIAIGPEGGWTAHEAARLEERGFEPITLGPRALRVDTAVAYAVAQAELWLRAGANGA